MDEIVKRGRGRPKKIKLSDDDKFEEILFKAFNFSVDDNGTVKMQRNGTPLTLEETSFLVWMNEGKKTKKPLSNMMMLKTERSALEKFRNGLAKIGVKNFDDVFDDRFRMVATNKYGATDAPE